MIRHVNDQRRNSPLPQNVQPRREDTYRDTAERLRNDPHFHEAVTLLYHLAVSHHFTPGELKQIAFAAAVRCEEHAVRSGLAHFPRRDG
jgi:hypothetical protein